MRRRDFITLLGGAATWPLATQAQQATMPLIGYLGIASPESFAGRLRAFRLGHDDPPTKQRAETYRGPPVTLGHMRAHGVWRLLIYCSTGLCHHSATIEADRWPDDRAVRDLCRKAVCTKRGMIGADVRPDWAERPQPESLTGTQWS